MNQAKQWLKKNGLTPHHSSPTQIQLIPTNLHGKVPHIGSASDLRLMSNVGTIANRASVPNINCVVFSSSGAIPLIPVLGGVGLPE